MAQCFLSLPNQVGDCDSSNTKRTERSLSGESLFQRTADCAINLSVFDNLGIFGQ